MSEEKLDEFQVQLTQAMRRVDARAETVAKFLAIAVEVHDERTVPWRQRKNRWAFFLPAQQAWAMGTVAAVLVVGVLIGGYEVREQRQVEAQQRAEAQREFETATQITDRALEHTRQLLERAGVRPED
jgi:hypothetical protein